MESQKFPPMRKAPLCPGAGTCACGPYLGAWAVLNGRTLEKRHPDAKTIRVIAAKWKPAATITIRWKIS